MALNTRSELEEERRLFYVAITRAEKSCTISYANSRFVFGSLNSSEPSRFISEINKDFLKFESPYQNQSGGRSLNGRSTNFTTNEENFQGFRKTPHPNSNNLRALSDIIKTKPSLQNELTSSLKVGFNVSHDLFGKGKVIKIEGQGDEKKAIIFFPKEGSKTLLLKFAKLTILE
jgi:DNA helicase-2/ATP-dependent DNA helicase PcrA